MKSIKRQLIISIGTGRSGSVSLSYFLSHQNKMRVLHEGRIDEKKIRKLIKWSDDKIELFNWLTFLENSNSTNHFFGDTGMYYLPYIKDIIKKYPNVKIIGLVRDKKSVVNSYLNKTKNRNHWFNHNGKKWKKDEVWDACYPKYPEEDKKKALGLYWDEYNKTSLNLQLEYPKNVKIWKIEEFNSIKGKNEILDFIGYNLERDTTNNFILNQAKKETILHRIRKIWS